MELNLLNLLLVLLAAWTAGQLAQRVGYPSVLGELVAGILLGPPLLGLLHGDAALAVLAELGVMLMMLYIGMEIEPAALQKASWGGILAAAGGFITPFVLCYLLVIGTGGTQMGALFVGVAAGVTSLATKSRILVDLKLLDTRIAHVMMAGALVTDTASLVIFAAVIGVAEAGSLDVMGLVWVAVKALGFLGATALIGLKLLPLLGRWFRGGMMAPLVAFTLVVLVGLLFAEGAHVVGLHGILGAFLAGLFLSERMFGRQLKHEVADSLRRASLGLLAPVFFVTAGFAVSFDVFTSDLGLLVGVIALATVGKIVGTALFYLPTGHGWREGIVLGAGMNGRGAVEIIIAQIALGLGLISQNIFSILVFTALFTTATVPVFLKWGTEWLGRRGELARSERKGTLLIGAGPVARMLGGLLARTEPVWVVDRNPEHCDLARKEGLQVVVGNALEEEVLSEAQASNVRRVIALTPNLEVNALAVQLARSVFGVPDVHVYGSGGEETRTHLGATLLFAAPVRLENWDYLVLNNRAVKAGLEVNGAASPEALFRQVQEEGHMLPLALRRGEQYFPFHSESTVEPGDRLLVLQPTDPSRYDRFDRLVMDCPILDVSGTTPLAAFCDAAADLLAPRMDVDAAELAEKLLHRESVSSTILMPGLAVPHVFVEGAGKFDLLVARYRDGIMFPGQPELVHAAFVLVGTQDERTFHLRALSAIAQVVQRPEFEAEWLQASGPEALRHLVLHTERRRFTPTEDV